MNDQQSNIEILCELKKSGALHSLITSGLFPSKIVSHMEIYVYIDASVLAGEKKTNIVTQASIEFDINESRIYRIIKAFQKKI